MNRVNANGKQIKATIQDMCPSCPKGALDLSTGAFRKLAPLSKGVVYGNWGYQ
jgi:expansin (peptidoglycan-binding protein)